MDVQFWNDMLMAVIAEIIPVSCLLAMIEARHDQEAGIEPGFYP